MPVSPTDTGIPEPAPPPSKSHHRHGSRASQSSGKSDAKSHQEYLDSLVPPSKELMKQITRAQEQKEEENLMKKLSMDGPDMSEGRKRAAATLIQRNYRGHRERRMLRGMSLDPSARWVEAIKEAKYRHMIEPRARPSLDDAGSTWNENGPSTARQQWKKIGLITMRAGGDPDSESDSVDENLSPEEREAYRQRRAQEKIERQKAAKIMDLQYFLEMVDLKHRYGANLRVYHEEWKMANTTDNFFYWLDQGEGRLIDCQGCPREQLDREQVRYLSKEERFNYLVKIDEQGRLCWAKNGARIDTTEKFKDSIHGIVPENDPTPAFTPMAAEPTPQDSSGDTTSISSVDEHEAAKDTKQTNTTTLNHPPPVKKVKRVSAATIFDKLLRGSVKANTWIFVADTNFRLYVGMKQSGVFQHSSFLHGSRISAAGSIKIQSGRLSRLSPLSGHYRPPVSNFNAFLRSLRDADVDMSRLRISRSYALLIGFETYLKGRKRGRKLVHKLMRGRDKLLAPGEEQEERERTEEVERQRRMDEVKMQAEKEDKPDRAGATLLQKLHIGSRDHGKDKGQ